MATTFRTVLHLASTSQKPAHAHFTPCRLPSHRHRLHLTTPATSSSPSSPAPESPSNSDSTTKRNPTPGSLKAEAQQSNREVYDRLITVFLTRKPDEWRKLIAHSSTWPTLAQGVLDRMEERAKEIELEDDEQARNLRRTVRRLKSVSDELSDYAALVAEFRGVPSREWESMVSVYRNSLGGEFFSYIELRVRAAASAAAAAGAEESKEVEALAALGTQLAALIEAHDRVLADEDALESAADRFADLLQSESMEAAELKLDELAASGKLDPALLLTMARAYAGVKETDVTKEEVKDIMAHLYFKAKESFARQAPPEARILKFLLAVESPSDRVSLMEQAFQSGAELSTPDEDYLHTTPVALLNTIENILTMYDNTKQQPQQNSGGGGGGIKARIMAEAAAASQGGGGAAGMAGQAAALMNPEVISRLRDLQQTLKKKYL